MKTQKFLDGIGLLITLALAVGCSDATNNTYTDAQIDSIVVISPDEVEYQPLNPARAETSPKAGVLWGDIRENVPSGVLLQFAEGFSSPPHIHNITYRAIVISGEIHNDDPDAANMWMGPGTFWTQPAGEVHITSARPGVGGIGFLEILEGPYLVQPSDMAFDNGERPLNLVSSNMVWMSADQLSWIESDADTESGLMAAFLWGDVEEGELSGSIVKLPSGYGAELSTTGGDLRAVVIQGDVIHSVPRISGDVELGPGGYFSSFERIPHSLKCETDDSCLIYVRTEGRFRLQ
ncbi:MAG: DUF4437 domain-containing protein [Pseudomonadota bacterium]